MTAEAVLAGDARLQAPPPGAARLAVLLSTAVKIEPDLIRAVRLTVAPWLDVGCEADLWFSDWVGVRSVDSIMLRPEILPDLRGELAARLRASPAGHPVHAIWPVLSRCHANISPALRLEERVTFLAVAGGHDDLPPVTVYEIERTLQRTLRALVDEGRDGIADWYAAAWQRLPESVRQTKSGWLLRQAVNNRLPELAIRMTGPAPAGLSPDDAAIALRAIGDVRLAIRHDGQTLTVGSEVMPGAVAIAVPDTRPRLLEATWSVDDGARSASLAIAEGETVRAEVGSSVVRLRTARGAIYRIGPEPLELLAGGAVAIAGPGMTELRAAGPQDAEPQDAGSAETQSQGGIRRRLRRLASGRRSDNPVLEPLIRTAQSAHPETDARLIERAFETAEHWHAGQFRKSGDPYVTHPLAVATILAELGMSQETLCAALLRETVEDTGYSLEELRGDFGDDIAALVDGVAKLDKIKYGEAAETETVRRMVVAMSRDIRVLMIKLASRLHNMRTLRYLAREKQERKSRETLEIFAPLTRRLGLNSMVTELEDLAFAYLYPQRYDEVARQVSERSPHPEATLRETADMIRADLSEAKIKGQVTGRTKPLYAIYQKMIAKNKSFDDIYDLAGVRILVDSVRDCYAALGTVHARWNPVPGRFKDYIAMPKFNMYQSLHTTVIGPGGRPVELQIRTHAMHRRSEFGTAAEWRYKEETYGGGSPPASSDPDWLRQLVDWQRETEDPAEFLESPQFDVGSAEVYVFTPRGEIIALPEGATPVDFAYAIHTEVGHRTVGAKVDGRLVSLDSPLSNGARVEILTSKAANAGPSQGWLGFVKSSRARSKINQWFAKERRQTAAETGRSLVARMMRDRGLPLQRVASADAMAAVATELRYRDLNDMYVAVGEGDLSAADVVTRLTAPGLAPAVEAPGPAQDVGAPGVVVVDGAAGVLTRLAKCCTPANGDPISGFVTRGHGVTIHRADCQNLQHAMQAQPERVVAASWPAARPRQMFVIQVEALDRTGLLSDITRAIAEQQVEILSATVTTGRDRIAVSTFTFEADELGRLRQVLMALRAVDGVYDAQRITG